MFVVLDTNHYDELASDSVFGRNAQRRIEDHEAMSSFPSHDGLLLTRNLSDFENVPGLRVENWLD